MARRRKYIIQITPQLIGGGRKATTAELRVKTKKAKNELSR